MSFISNTSSTASLLLPIYSSLEEILNTELSQLLDRPQEYLESFMHITFQWDMRALCQNLEMKDDERICTSKTSMQSFKTVYGNQAMFPGNRYYYEVKFLKGSNFKIGVSKSKRNLDIAFSDTADGWAYYSNGQLRHGSKGEGAKYGEVFRGKDTIGVYVDLVDGILFFSKNGKIFRDAYKTVELLEQELYPACCCLTKGESFELLFPLCED